MASGVIHGGVLRHLGRWPRGGKGRVGTDDLSRRLISDDCSKLRALRGEHCHRWCDVLQGVLVDGLLISLRSGLHRHGRLVLLLLILLHHVFVLDGHIVGKRLLLSVDLLFQLRD